MVWRDRGRVSPQTAYNLAYRFFRMPWEIGPRAELVELVDAGRLRPGRAIDLGCGTGANAVFLAQTGFRHDLGRFDLLVDYGTLDDLSARKRDRYVRSVLPLADPGARFLLWCFEWRPRRMDRWLHFEPMAPGEIAERFGGAFELERIAGTARPEWWRF